MTKKLHFSIVLAFCISIFAFLTSSQAQRLHEIKLNTFEFLDRGIMFGYETGLGTESSLEFLIGYNPYLQLYTWGSSEPDTYTYTEWSFILMTNFYLDKNRQQKHGFGIAPFVHFVLNTNVDDGYEEHYFQIFGTAYDRDVLRSVYTGFQLFYKAQLYKNLFVEPSVGPAFDPVQWIDNRLMDLDFAIQLKLNYRFN